MMSPSPHQPQQQQQQQQQGQQQQQQGQQQGQTRLPRLPSKAKIATTTATTHSATVATPATATAAATATNKRPHRGPSGPLHRRWGLGYRPLAAGPRHGGSGGGGSAASSSSLALWGGEGVDDSVLWDVGDDSFDFIDDVAVAVTAGGDGVAAGAAAGEGRGGSRGDAGARPPPVVLRGKAPLKVLPSVAPAPARAFAPTPVSARAVSNDGGVKGAPAQPVQVTEPREERKGGNDQEKEGKVEDEDEGDEEWLRALQQASPLTRL